MAAVDKLTPADPRVQHRFFTTGSRTYHYLLAEPDGDKSRRPAATVLLIHGFPDLAFGWRYQIPALLARRDNLRVVAPDMLGYGRSDAPRDPAAYSHKRVVDDLAALVRHVLAGDGEGGRVQAAEEEEEEEEEEEKIVLGGHDWGGAVAWRFALWYPGLVRAIFSVCTPYLAPAEAYLGLEEVVRRVPNFGYQLQFAGEEVEGNVVGRERIRAFLSLLYGAKGKDDGGRLFDAASGVALDKVVAGQVGESALLSREEMDFYADEYARNGMRGPLNWYRTRRFNFDEERKLVEQGRTRVTMPALMVVASRDPALPPAMAAVMDKHCDDLVKKEVNATHWALWEAPSEVNQHIGEFLDRILKDQPPKASI